MPTVADPKVFPAAGANSGRRVCLPADSRLGLLRSAGRRALHVLASTLVVASMWGLVPPPAGAAGPTPYCLQAKTMQVLTTCETVDASVNAKVLPEGIELTVVNESQVEWQGRPVAAETTDLTVDEADVVAVNEDVPAAYAELVSREDVAVSRCVFPSTVEALEPGASISCVLPGTPTSNEIVVWLTGFIGGIPVASEAAGLGTEPTPLGVIPVATPRSIRLDVAGASGQSAQAEVIDPRTVEASPVGIEQKRQSALEPALVAGGVAAAGLGGVVLWQRRRKSAAAQVSGG